jgi:hypothetical protein
VFGTSGVWYVIEPRLPRSAIRPKHNNAKAIQLLLSSLPLEYLWTGNGPTEQARQFSRVRRCHLASKFFCAVLLICAFDLWNGAGKVLLYQGPSGHARPDAYS